MYTTKMINIKLSPLAFVLLVVISFQALASAVGALKVGFYNSSCPQAESIIRQIVQTRFGKDKSITAALLRMHFHDCFVRGCDASILIDSTKNQQSEKEAGPNLTVRGFDLIDDIKSKLEAACPATVSCADIIAVATRDSVALAGGANYAVPTGRRDGLISNADDVDLPGPSFTVAQAQQAFKTRGLTLQDMTVLLGGHSVGVAHCSFFQDRLSSPVDTTMSPSLVAKLTKTCTSTTTTDPTAFLDQATPFKMDNAYYNQIKSNNGVMQIDQELALDKSASTLVSTLASNEALFRRSFADAMIKLGKVQVLEGKKGQIRKKCRAVN